MSLKSKNMVKFHVYISPIFSCRVTFLEIDIFASLCSDYAPNLFFISSQYCKQFSRLDSKRSFACIPTAIKLHKLNYTVITYDGEMIFLNVLKFVFEYFCPGDRPEAMNLCDKTIPCWFILPKGVIST